MTRAADILRDIEFELRDPATGQVRATRPLLLALMSEELRELTGMEAWDWAMVHLDPVVQTVTGTHTYDLPDNFPENFVRYGGDSGESWVCKLDDASNESLLTYKPPTEFYSQNLRALSNGRPESYTIVTSAAGRRQIRLAPPPDANGTSNYTIDGLYIPTDWTLDEESQIPPIPGNSAILKHAVLRRLDTKFETSYQTSYSILMMRAAQQRRAQFTPMRNKYGSSWNSYAGARR